jgi:hypothetical protein
MRIYSSPITKNLFIQLAMAMLMVVLIAAAAGCSGSKPFSDQTPPEKIVMKSEAGGTPIEIHFQRGKHHNHPLMVFWIEDEEGNYIRTLYIAESIAKGTFRYGAKGEGHWMPGEIQRPSSLPYWAHKRGIRNESGNMIPSPKMPMPDAVTGPTPKRNFILGTSSGSPVPKRFVIKMEINQTWDFNEYWTNGKYPGNSEYIASCQPALVYEALVDLTGSQKEFIMKPIGHSHYDGSDGSLTKDLSTITTALDIAREVKVVLP